MKAIIIEDETAAVSSLKAILRHNSVVDIEDDYPGYSGNP